MKKITNLENPTNYEIVLQNESIFDFATRCGEYRDAISTVCETETIDSHYQLLFDRVIDSLIVVYDSGGIETAISGLREGMHERRRYIFQGKRKDDLE